MSHRQIGRPDPGNGMGHALAVSRAYGSLGSLVSSLTQRAAL
jgi:hypothetical protein